MTSFFINSMASVERAAILLGNYLQLDYVKPASRPTMWRASLRP